MGDMSEHRRPTIPFSDAPRGVCRWCGKEIVHESGEKKGTVNLRRRWHETCVAVYNASDPREARRRIRRRDRGRCARCSIDTYRVRRELKRIGRGRSKAIRARGYKPGKSFWELDHIVPLIDGGTHDDDNLQTLCTPCHTRKSAEEARNRAARKAGSTSLPASPTEPGPQKSASTSTRSSKSKDSSAPPDLDTLLAAADEVNARVMRSLRGEMEPPGLPAHDDTADSSPRGATPPPY